MSVSCAQRSLKPAKNPSDEQRESPVVGALSRVDGQVEQSTGEGERDHHRERTADQRTQPAEEARRTAADVVFELELAAVDALDDADDRAERACDSAATGVAHEIASQTAATTASTAVTIAMPPK